MELVARREPQVRKNPGRAPCEQMHLNGSLSSEFSRQGAWSNRTVGKEKVPAILPGPFLKMGAASMGQGRIVPD